MDREIIYKKFISFLEENKETVFIAECAIAAFFNKHCQCGCHCHMYFYEPFGGRATVINRFMNNCYLFSDEEFMIYSYIAERLKDFPTENFEKYKGKTLLRIIKEYPERKEEIRKEK